MLSPRRSAQLGVVLVLFVLASSLSVLLARGTAGPTGMIGRMASPIELRSTRGTQESLERYRGKIVVLWFNSIRCPMTGTYSERVARLSRDLSKLPEVRMISIHEGSFDSLDAVEVQARVAGIDCPIWIDPDGRTASAYRMTHTPGFVVIDREGRIRYHGAQDDDASGQHITRRYIRQAVQALLNHQPVPTELTQARGCPIDAFE